MSHQYNGETVQLRSDDDVSMCLASTEYDDVAPLYYKKCNVNDEHQFYDFKKLKGRSQYMFGMIHAQNDNYCVWLYDGYSFLDSDCDDIWEILETGVLKSIHDKKCIGRSTSNITRVEAVDCDSESATIWSPYAI